MTPQRIKISASTGVISATALTCTTDFDTIVTTAIMLGGIMKIITYLRQPHNVGIVLFGLAAAILISIIATGLSGFVSVAQLLNEIAPPVCASAIGVLLYLALVTRRLEKSAAKINS